MKTSIGQRIKKKREACGLTQKQVADQLFVTQQTVARWESDQHQPPIRAIEDLAAIFDVKTAYFFGDQITVKKTINIFALIGVLMSNILFFWMILVILISIELMLWGMTLGCFGTPIVIFWQSWQSHRIYLDQAFEGIIMMVGAIISIPIQVKLTEYIWRILRAYYRYNINSIFYEKSFETEEK